MKRIVIIVRASAGERVAEALRGAIGVSLRGDRVHVVLTDAAAPAARGADPRIRRAVATLAALGHEVTLGDAHLAPAVRAADAIEVWT